MNLKVEAKEYGTGITKGLIGAVPYVCTLMNEILFDTRSRIKQERLNSFITLFGEFIKSKSGFIEDISEIDQETFGDVYEEILISVSKTNAKHKIDTFKRILFNQFQLDEESSDDAIRYINLTNSITLTQFIILSRFNSLSDRVQLYRVNILESENEIVETNLALQKENRLAAKGFANNTILYEQRIKDARQSIKSKVKAIKENINPSDHKLYNLSKDNFLIEIHDLIGKGLLQDLSLETIYIKPLELFKITRLGRKYMEYVKEP